MIYSEMYVTKGSITATWLVKSSGPVTDFEILADYADTRSEWKVTPSVSFSVGLGTGGGSAGFKIGINASPVDKIEKGTTAYAKIEVQE